MPSRLGGSPTESFLGVPIVAGDRVIGVIAMERLELDAYTEADERLLSTLASSMGVALENARLFGETKRLLAESDQRAAELAVVNEIGTALAKQLEFDAIIELVGERVRAIFEPQSMFDRPVRRRSTNASRSRTRSTKASASIATARARPGLTSIVIRTRRPLRLGPRRAAGAAGAITFGGRDRSRGSASRSWPVTRSSASSASRASTRTPSTRPTSGC